MSAVAEKTEHEQRLEARDELGDLPIVNWIEVVRRFAKMKRVHKA